MATLVLTAAGSMFGPIGGALGGIIGRAIDSRLFAPDPREGPRLKELAVTSSSYGTPIARHYGQMRAAGTIIWSTDLVEHSENEGGGKGQPATTSYRYSVSFAVALSSRPIDGLGRIWADGNLLRGAGGDLKSAGDLRIYTGHGDQPADPLMQAALGAQCPAHRGCAYVVFEDLDLTDFGNRIPALSFEIMAGDGAQMIGAMLDENGLDRVGAVQIPALTGFSHEGGTLRQIVQLVDRLHPMVPRVSPTGVGVGEVVADQQPLALPPPCAWGEGAFGKTGGVAMGRSHSPHEGISALRYYDPARDYQPGIQHVSSNGAMFEFPAALAAADARDLAQQANRRTATMAETLAWRCATLDPAIAPGALVTAPGIAGLWRVLAWEWREGGVELELVRHRTSATASAIADSGSGWTPADRQAGQTVLRVFELPWDGFGNASSRKAYAAIGATSGRWAGAALYTLRGDALEPTGLSAQRPAVMGELMQQLGGSPCQRFEPGADCLVSLINPDAVLASADLAQLASGANRLLVGSEILQFAEAEPIGPGQWRLSGLLRGRAGTESAAGPGHTTGTAITLIDHRLVDVSAEWLARQTDGFAAMGPQDTDPAIAPLECPMDSLRPPGPVHPSRLTNADGDLLLCWTRRARGGWQWLDGVDQPLIEESELYEVGYGPLDSPFARWTSSIPRITIPAGNVSALAQSHPPSSLWVRQIGSFARSHPLDLGPLF